MEKNALLTGIEKKSDADPPAVDGRPRNLFLLKTLLFSAIGALLRLAISLFFKAAFTALEIRHVRIPSNAYDFSRSDPRPSAAATPASTGSAAYGP